MLRLLYCALIATAALAACTGPTPTPPPTFSPSGVIAPIDANLPQAFLAALPANEQACLAANSDPQRVITLAGLPGAEISSPQEFAELIECLSDDTLLRVFLSGMLVNVGPLSQDSSDCVRAGFANFNLRPVIIAGDVASGPGGDLLARAARFGSLRPFALALSCLNEAEWEAGRWDYPVTKYHWKRLKCVRETLGGPENLAAVLPPLDRPLARTFMHAESECVLLPMPTPAASGEISLVNRDNPQAFLASLPADEQTCLSEYPDPMRVTTLSGWPSPVIVSPYEAAEMVSCLSDDTLLRIFLRQIIADIGRPLSRESSTCIRAGLSNLDLRSAMLAEEIVPGMYSEFRMALGQASYLVPLCLNNAERPAAFPHRRSNDAGWLAELQCIREKLGGPPRTQPNLGITALVLHRPGGMPVSEMSCRGRRLEASG